jgi:hypothetical protein
MKKGVLFGIIYVLSGFLFPVRSKDTVNDFLRTPALMIMGNLLSVRRNSRGDDMQVGVVRVMV